MNGRLREQDAKQSYGQQQYGQLKLVNSPGHLHKPELIWPNMEEKELIAILTETGPLTGAQLVERTGEEVLSLWKSCRKANSVHFARAGKRYLRLDRNVEGYARLSPSIRREFLTYTFVGLDSQLDALNGKARHFNEETKRISQAKRDVAKESIIAAISKLPDKESIVHDTCYVLAGDVVYDMSHVVARPEKSTGEMVRGSDLDIIVITKDELDPAIVKSLDNAIHKRKHWLLYNDREEIDYLIKSISRMKEQLKFDIFPSMIACKILDEGELLYGSPEVFQLMKDLLEEYGVPAKLRSLERQATESRDLAEAQLLEADVDADRSAWLNLFYTHAEEDEIY
jgi:hypothetical protein